jgi:hypothetical protein
LDAWHDYLCNLHRQTYLIQNYLHTQRSSPAKMPPPSGPIFTLLDRLAWTPATQVHQAAILGAVVRDIADPFQNYVSARADYITEDLLEQRFEDFVVQRSSDNEQGFAAQLAGLAGVRFAGTATTSFSLASKLVTLRRLQQTDEFWERLREDPDVERRVPGWVRKAARQRPVCLVVGVAYFQDVDVCRDESEARVREAMGEVPLGTVAMAAAGGPLALLGGSDDLALRAKVHRSAKVGDIFAARASDPRIFALQYKKIVSKWWRDGGKIELTRDVPLGNQLASRDDEDDEDEEDESAAASFTIEDWSPDLDSTSG